MVELKGTEGQVKFANDLLEIANKHFEMGELREGITAADVIESLKGINKLEKNEALEKMHYAHIWKNKRALTHYLNELMEE